MRMAIAAVGQGVCRRFPPELAVLMSDFGRTTEQSVGGIRLSSSDPTSVPSEPQCNKSSVFASSATLLLLTQRLLCCIDQLKPRPKAAAGLIQTTKERFAKEKAQE